MARYLFSKRRPTITIIVYKNDVIAGDTLIACDTMRWSHTKKVAKSPDGYLMGAAGDMIFVRKFIDWGMMEDREEYNPPVDKHSAGVLVTPQKEILLYEGTTNPTKILSDYICLGSGSAVALGAIYMGASAVEAVNAAIKYDGACEGPVTVEKF